MASTIFFDGRVTSIPGAYTKIDASGLEQIGLGASGIVALVGTAEGGIPVTAISTTADFLRITKPQQGRDLFRSGDLREAIPFTFEPARDEEIQAGAQEIILMKVNPATQSTAVLANAQGDAIDLTSSDYGAHTEQVNITIATGTNKGKLVTIIFEDVTESGDDIGGDVMFNLKYSEAVNSYGWDTATAQINSGGVLQVNGSRAESGGDGDIATPLAAPRAIQIHSTNAADIGNEVTVWGLSSGAPVKETLVLNGTTIVTGTTVFDAAGTLGVYVAGTVAGTITIEDSGGAFADIWQFTAGTDQYQSMVPAVAMFMGGGALTVVADAADVTAILVEGITPTGAVAMEKVTLAGTTPVATTTLWSRITAIASANTPAARTLTFTGDALLTTADIHNTLQKIGDYANARTELGDGFTFTMVTGETARDPDELDISVAAVDCLSPANPAFYADLYGVINWINANSQYMSAARSTGATGGAPSNTVTPTYLTGGVEGTATTTEWQLAFNLLKQVRVNTVVPLTSDPAIHAMAEAHCAYMGGAGRSERDCIVGIQNTGRTGPPTKTEFKSQIVDLNSRHVRAVGQTATRFNIAGERTVFQPHLAACLPAGMQAGSPVGTSLTWKYINVLDFDQDSSWNPTDDAEEMIKAGALIMEFVDGKGRRWVRNVTTHLSSTNLAYQEGSVNEAVNYAAFTFRNDMEYAVGRKGFAGTENAAKGVGLKSLNLLVDEEILVAHQALNIERVADVLETSVQMAPVVPINFVPITIHLVTAS